MDASDDTAPPYDAAGDDLVASIEDDGEALTSPMTSQPSPVMAVVLAIGRKRPARPPRPRRRRAVVPPGAAGWGHGARRTKEFLQWREWYLRAKRREKEEAMWYHIVGIPPAY